MDSLPLVFLLRSSHYKFLARGLLKIIQALQKFRCQILQDVYFNTPALFETFIPFGPFSVMLLITLPRRIYFFFFLHFFWLIALDFYFIPFALPCTNSLCQFLSISRGINTISNKPLSSLKHRTFLWGVSDGEGNGTPPQYSCLENPMDGGAWKAAVHGVAKSRTRLSDFTFTFHFYALEKEMATHSSVLAWRIPGTGEPVGLPSMGSHRVGHDWSDLAAAVMALGFPGSSAGKESVCNTGDPGSIAGLGRSLGGGHGNSLQYSFLDNSYG